ncbi:MAG TPA: right-handed parallel beta-helix repeat-containing protein [Saprospiraceae bacterium]|nr:right-handed parallel beta-helix repeat-containing protein [Saprospiraceae bacterium]
MTIPFFLKRYHDRRVVRWTGVLLMAAVFLAPGFFLTSCYDEKFTTDTNDTLAIRIDTLTFDTVLTQVSTVTRFFKVYNPHGLSVRVSEIKVTGKDAHFFRLNVDGYTGDIIRNIDILPEDSIYVFAEATIDPDQPLSISPFILEAEIVFTTNNTDQEVTLIAWGQNANYIPGPNTPNRISLLTCDFGEVIWDDPKPYVLYGTLLIDSCTLVLPPGARLYVHGGIANNQLGIYNEGLIYTLPSGKLRVMGSVTDPVIIRDDRIEPDHVGSWAGIRLGPESGPHQFSYMEMSSANAGIIADSASTVNIDHSSIANTGGPGFYARHATANISNSLFYENGGQSIALTFGGEYEINYCTVASFGNDAEAILMNNFYCTDPICSEGVLINQFTGRINNSILIGSSSDEVWMADAGMPGQGLLDVQMRNNMVVVDELLDPDNYPTFFETICFNCFEYSFGDTLFVDMFKDDYHLDTMSVAEMKGIPLPGLTDDRDGNVRDLLLPDLGCYEFQE